MKLVVSFLFFAVILSCNTKKEKPQQDTGLLTAKQLVEIISDSSLPAFKKLVKDINYLPVDSSVTANGEIMYGAEESEAESGDYTSVKTSKDHHVNYLHFTTFKEGLYRQLKKQFIIDHDFIMTDTDAGMDEYESGHIGLVIMTYKDKEGTSYDFFLLRKF